MLIHRDLKTQITQCVRITHTIGSCLIYDRSIIQIPTFIPRSNAHGEEEMCWHIPSLSLRSPGVCETPQSQPKELIVQSLYEKTQDDPPDIQIPLHSGWRTTDPNLDTDGDLSLPYGLCGRTKTIVTVTIQIKGPQ